MVFITLPSKIKVPARSWAELQSQGRSWCCLISHPPFDVLQRTQIKDVSPSLLSGNEQNRELHCKTSIADFMNLGQFYHCFHKILSLGIWKWWRGAFLHSSCFFLPSLDTVHPASTGLSEVLIQIRCHSDSPQIPSKCLNFLCTQIRSHSFIQNIFWTSTLCQASFLQLGS